MTVFQSIQNSTFQIQLFSRQEIKNSIIIFSLIFCISNLKSQNYYQRIYDDFEYDTDTSFSMSNDQLDFSWQGSAQMESLIMMYESTTDTKYLQTLIIAMSNIIDRRDDLRSSVGLPLIADYRGVIGAVWSTDNYNTSTGIGTYGYIVHSGNITYPMAKFAALIKNGPSTLQNKTSTSFGGRYADMTYLAIANDLISKIQDTIDYHEDQWRSFGSIGYYKQRCGSNVPINPDAVCEIIPLNRMAAIGRTFVQLYLATNDSEHLDKVDMISNFFKLNMKDSTTIQSKKWRFFGNSSGTYSQSDLREDVSHGGLTAAFPYECYKEGIKVNGNPIYSSTEMTQLANTFSKDIYRGPLELNNGIDDGNRNEYWNLKTPHNSNNQSSLGTYASFRWIPYSEFDNQIFQIISDFYTSNNYNVSGVSGLTKPLTLSLMSRHSNHFNPIAANHGWGSAANWNGVACGNFDDDGTDEIVAIRNLDGNIYLRKVSGDSFISLGFNNNYDSSYKWSGLATGNFFGDSKDEFVTLSNSQDGNKNGYYVFSIENGMITEVAASTGWGTASDWSGVAAGNFIDGGPDEFITTRNNNKEIRLYRFSGTNVVWVNTISLTSTLPSGAKIVGLASGNLDGTDPEDELVVLVNSPDGDTNGFYVYDVNSTGNLLTEIARRVGWGTNSDWKGITVGDFDADGVDEFVVHRNFNGNYVIQRLCGTLICTTGTEYFPVNQTLNNILGAGNLNSETVNDELIVLRNYDGGMVTFTSSDSLLEIPNGVSSKAKIMSTNEQNIAVENSVSIYPVPTSNTLNVVTGDDISNLNYVLYNLSGIVVQKGQANNEPLTIDVSNLKKGVYFLYFKGQAFSEIKKIIVN